MLRRIIYVSWLTALAVSPATAAQSKVQFEVGADPDRLYDIQGSNDLRNWEDITTNRSGDYSFDSTQTDFSGYRFFRAADLTAAPGETSPIVLRSTVVPVEEPPVEGRSLGFLEDFEAYSNPAPDPPLPVDLGPITVWSWSEEEVANAPLWSSRRVVENTDLGGKAMEVTMDPELWNHASSFGFHWVRTVNGAYLDPEADAIRMKVKVLEGSFRLTFGAITIRIGNSDAYTDWIDVGPTNGSWRTIEFPLNHRLMRNFRHRGLDDGAPMIYYSRYLQEPSVLMIGQGSTGRILVDDIEVIAKGEGRPYPTFEPEEVTPIRTVADFTDPADEDQAISFLILPEFSFAEPEPVNFQQPNQNVSGAIDFSGVRKTWSPPPVWSRLMDEGSESQVLEVQHRGYETFGFFGLRALGAEGANAFAVTVKATHSNPRFRGRPLTLEIAALGTLPGQAEAFPWDQMAPPDEWTGPGSLYTHYFNRTATAGVPWTLYHAKRRIPEGQWTTIIIPYADFVCSYAREGTEAEPIRREQRPLTNDSLVGLVFSSPFAQLTGTTTYRFDEISLVHVPGSPAELRSYYQYPDVTQFQLVNTGLNPSPAFRIVRQELRQDDPAPSE